MSPTSENYRPATILCSQSNKPLHATKEHVHLALYQSAAKAGVHLPAHVYQSPLEDCAGGSCCATPPYTTHHPSLSRNSPLPLSP